MLIKIDSIRNKFAKRVIEHCVYLIILLVCIPSFYYFELFVVLPAVVEEWTVPYFIHFSVGHFLLLNIIGNMIYGMFTNTSIKGRVSKNDSKSDWEFCAVCECHRPPRAWHCSNCDVCILKRDHHCTFFATCVGYYNHRYFILFTFYVFVAMVYAFYYNVQFLYQNVTWSHTLVLLRFLFPLASVMIDSESNESLFIALFVVNVIAGLFTGFLFTYHFKNILKGRIVYEKNTNDEDSIYDLGWKLNLIEVFGKYWYLTWILPFIKSPLPGNGLEWQVNKQKIK